MAFGQQPAQDVERQGGKVRPGLDGRTVLQRDGSHPVAVDRNAGGAPVEHDAAAPPLDVVYARRVQVAQRNGGQAHLVAPAIDQKGPDGRPDSVFGVDVFQLVVQRADHDGFPERLDGPLRRAVGMEPGGHGDGGRLRISVSPRSDGVANHAGHGADDRELVPDSHRFQPHEGWKQVKGRREARRPDDRNPAGLVDERNGLVEVDMFRDAEAIVEVDEVDAAAQEHVLAVVHPFAARRVYEGGGAAPEDRTSFVQLDREAGVGQRDRPGQSGQPATDYDYFTHTRFLIIARAVMESFFHGDRPMRWLYTSYCRRGISSRHAR